MVLLRRLPSFSMQTHAIEAFRCSRRKNDRGLVFDLLLVALVVGFCNGFRSLGSLVGHPLLFPGLTVVLYLGLWLGFLSRQTGGLVSCGLGSFLSFLSGRECTVENGLIRECIVGTEGQGRTENV
jgi:hypothetical protein